MTLARDPKKARAWQQRSVAKAQENARSKPRAGLSPRSAKPSRRAHQVAVAAACGAAIRRDGDRCQALGILPGVCWGPLDPQHVIPQGVRRDLAAVEGNIVACCRGHHSWIDDHPVEARRWGFHGRDGDDLAELAALRRPRC